MEINDLAQYLDASAWTGVGIVGVLLFVFGVYRPALASVPGGAYLSIGFAVAGGALAVLGFSFAYDRSQYERAHPRRPKPSDRAREIEISPSFEVYHPGEPVDTVALPPREEPPRLPEPPDA